MLLRCLGVGGAALLACLPVLGGLVMAVWPACVLGSFVVYQEAAGMLWYDLILFTFGEQVSSCLHACLSPWATRHWQA